MMLRLKNHREYEWGGKTPFKVLHDCAGSHCDKFPHPFLTVRKPGKKKLVQGNLMFTTDLNSSAIILNVGVYHLFNDIFSLFKVA